jgi:proteasome accessory factor B
MPADYTKKVQRLLKIIQLIQGSGQSTPGQPSAAIDSGWTATRLAKECGVKERTIFRDLNDLSAAGIPHFYDPVAKSYAIRRDYFMAPIQLSIDEALALVALAERVGKDEQIPMLKPAGKAISKIRAILPAKIRDELSPLDNKLAIKLSASSAPEAWEDIYTRIRSAIAKKKTLLCAYESLGKTVKDPAAEAFEFHPYVLLFNQRAWYAVGYHGRHKAVRSLKLQRFIKCDTTSNSFKVPDSFSLAKHLGNAWRMIRGTPTYDIHLKFTPDFAETIADTHWHPTQREEHNPDGSLELCFQVDGLDEIVWWVLSMGPHCTVISPPQLIQRVKELAAQTANLYPST